MKTLTTISLFLALGFSVQAQRVENIFFNLYTDSLKKGVYNYISVDGKLSNGGFLPLTTDEVFLSSTGGTWDHNSIIIGRDFARDSVVITAKLKNDTTLVKTITVYIKKVENPEKLKTKEEVFDEMQRTRKRGRK